MIRSLSLFNLLFFSLAISQICYPQDIISVNKLSISEIDTEYSISEEKAIELYKEKMHNDFGFLNGNIFSGYN